MTAEHPTALMLNHTKKQLAEILSQTFQQLFNHPVSVEEFYALIEIPPNTQMGDYALPCFGFAKLLRKAPGLVAKELQESIQNPFIKSVQVQNAFLNFFVNKSLVAKDVFESIAADTFFNMEQKTKLSSVMIEFSQPNTHKEFHVGHLRNVCLGDSLTRIFRHLGYKTTPVNYIGDEGAHVAKCLWALDKDIKNKPTSNVVEWYGQKYAQATTQLEEASPERKEEIQKELSFILSQLEKKVGPFYTLWQETRKDCLEEFDRIYSWLEVDFAHVFYESELTEECQKIADDYIKSGLFVESKGAFGIDMEPYKLGFFMARKSDGTSLYITKDLALARKKFDSFNIDKSIYVVASEQDFHFKQLFKALELMGFEQAKDCYHLSYAVVKRPDGKMSSRKGNTYTFQMLKSILKEELSKHLEKYKDQWPEEEFEETLKRLMIGSIKYGMLSADPGKEIIFDPKAWTAFEGNTGPYLMYSYARTQSILKKASFDWKNFDLSSLGDLEHESEIELLMEILKFHDTVLLAQQHYRPSVIATFCFELSKVFNRFYANVNVMKTENLALKQARLVLIASFGKTLFSALRLLGITPPDRM